MIVAFYFQVIITQLSGSVVEDNCTNTDAAQPRVRQQQLCHHSALHVSTELMFVEAAVVTDSRLLLVCLHHVKCHFGFQSTSLQSCDDRIYRIASGQSGHMRTSIYLGFLAAFV